MALELLPVDHGVGQRMGFAANQLQRHPADGVKTQFGGQQLLPPHHAKIGFAFQNHAADVFHHGEEQLQLHMREAGRKLGKQLAQHMFRV